MDVRLKILPPWSVYIKKLAAMFDPDPQIAFNVNWDGRNPSVTLATNNAEKAAGLAKLLPEEKVFGNVTLKINIDCPKTSNIAFPTARKLFETVFEGNPVFVEVITPEGYWFVDLTYVIFAHEVVMIVADNLMDPRGLISTLYQDIASEIFADRSYQTAGGICFATDIKHEPKLGDQKNWP